MKITNLIVEGLFGLYNYTIHFDPEGDDFTVLTSPNGYGKTTLLCVINSLHVKRLYYLYVLKYKSLCFKFDDSSELYVSEPVSKKKEENDIDTRRNRRGELCFVWKKEEEIICSFNYNPPLVRTAKQIVINNLSINRVFANEMSVDEDRFFIDGDGGEALNTEIARMQMQEQFLLQLATIQTDFIGANRIYTEGNRERILRMRNEQPILKVTQEMKRLLNSKMLDFQSHYQRLDSKLIDMLLDGVGNEISEEEYKKRSEDLKSLMDELSSYGLINKQELPGYRVDNSKMLDVYLEQMVEKLNFYQGLLPLVRLFDKFINQKHFANKTISLSPHHGLRIVSENGDILSPDMLSTGEQNQIVLLYDLIFKTPKGGILLIDEPESSLHVAWQNDFVSDMHTIAQSKSLQIVVATHSPIIVSNTPEDKVFDLYYLYKSGYEQ